MFSDIYMPLFISYQNVPLGHTILKAITYFKNPLRKIGL